MLLIPQSPFFSGCAQFAALGRGQSTYLAQAHTTRPIRTPLEGTGNLFLFAVIAGTARISGAVSRELTAGQSLVTLLAEDEWLDFQVPVGDCSVLTLHAEPAQLMADLGSPESAGLLRDAVGTGHVESLPADVSSSMQSLLQQPLQAYSDRARLRARGLEGWAAALAPVLGRRPALATRELSLRDLRRVTDLKAILDTEFCSPPSIDNLARRLCSNPAKVMRDFKAAYGETIGGFVTRLRMEHARELITVEGLRIGEAANRVGYNHQSSFSDAFRGHFGVAPRELKRQRHYASRH
jgi:AraC-like DNA-binding protein